METQFNRLLKKTGVYGIVNRVSHPIVFIEGLPKAVTHEIILFESGLKGEVFSINQGIIEARLFSHDPVKVGEKVTKTEEILSIPVGKSLFGQSINPLGEPIDSTIKFIRPKETREIEGGKPIGIDGREKITKNLLTGITLIDLLLPLGKGQRELIVGNRKTGKTSVLLTTIKNQVKEDTVAIYAAIAKKKSDIKKVQEFFINEKINNKVIMVSTNSYDSPTLIYQTPYAAMTIAEYFRDQGMNVLVVLDDLSTHAKFYRELSLLARRFPGRESYPGDIFFAHSSLLERAGNFKHPKVGEASITCLPVVETVEGDLASYISTNVMGITDGHIYFDSNIYYQGRRPAVNIPISVTRVGRQTLTKLTREINKHVSSFLTQYDRLLNLSHFGQELTPEVKKTMQLGDLIYILFNQPYQEIVPHQIQLIIISLILQGVINNKDILYKLKTSLIKIYDVPEWRKWMEDISSTNSIKTFNDNVISNKDKLLSLT